MKEKEKAIIEKHDKLIELRKNGNRFPKELGAAFSKTIKETTETMNLEAKIEMKLFS